MSSRYDQVQFEGLMSKNINSSFRQVNPNFPIVHIGNFLYSNSLISYSVTYKSLKIPSAKLIGEIKTINGSIFLK